MNTKDKYIVIDTETANGMDYPLCYDIGFAVVDNTGKVYAHYSYCVSEIFTEQPEMMQSAYYAKKLPRYYEEIAQGKRKILPFFVIRKIFRNVCRKWNVKAIMAHNMRFDNGALHNTAEFISEGRCRTFFPYGVPIWCTLTMARSIMGTRPVYIQWCKDNGYVTKWGAPRFTAEILTRFIRFEMGFIEKHQGIDDVMCEKDIFAYLIRQHKKMRRTYWKESA